MDMFGPSGAEICPYPPPAGAPGRRFPGTLLLLILCGPPSAGPADAAARDSSHPRRAWPRASLVRAPSRAVAVARSR
eukprot:1785178-Pyramimonas_sp.AAC.1